MRTPDPGRLHRSDPNWERIRRIFLEAGFDREEASHAANENLDPEPEEPKEHEAQIRMVKQMLIHRRKEVDTLMKYGELTWDEAVEDRARWAEETRRRKGLEDLDLFGGET